MLKSHWKKILLSVYIVVVLIISASVKAQANELRSEIKRLSAEINFLEDRGLLKDTNSLGLDSKQIKAEEQSFTGHFILNKGLDGLNKVYFVQDASESCYEVDSTSVKKLAYDLSSQDTYEVNGIVLKNSQSPHKTQFLPSLIVTSIKLQR